MIRCVGSAEERFDEDSLRILRAVRFSAQLDFTIEENTLCAIKAKVENLKNISAERIRVELTKLLISDHPNRLRLLYELGITSVVLPEFDAMMKTEQNNIHHIYSVGDHTIYAVSEVAGGFKEKRFGIKERTVLRLTMLLHDVEKPNTITLGKDGQNHFFGHQERGALTAKNILRRLKFDNDTIDAVVHLIRWHDYRFVLTPAGMRKAASKIGKEYMELLFEVNRADTSAKNPQHTKDKFDRLANARQLYCEIVEKGECVSLKELQINGKDLIEIGMKPGKRMGEILNSLLSEVLDNPSLNDRNILLTMTKQMLESHNEQ
jgi:tRNA nucleotidyltransferase (CCA-adding enzyme)